MCKFMAEIDDVQKAINAVCRPWLCQGPIGISGSIVAELSPHMFQTGRPGRGSALSRDLGFCILLSQMLAALLWEIITINSSGLGASHDPGKVNFQIKKE